MQHFLVIDDHPLFREAIQIAIRSVAPKAEIHEATTIEAAVDMIAGRRRGYDLALLDLSLPGTSGFDGLLLLRSRFPRQPILIVSAHDDPRIVREALSHGVAGFVSKAAKKSEIAQAIGRVLTGDVHAPADVVKGAPAEAGFADADLMGRLSSLTPQQMRVLQMLRQGLLNKQIAHELAVGETTVKAHVSEILRKLGVFSRTQAVIEASKIDFDRIADPVDGSFAPRR
jgi:DNA-binding NarL/FixJ family response regulator